MKHSASAVRATSRSGVFYRSNSETTQQLPASKPPSRLYAMKIQRSIAEPIRKDTKWEERWNAEDNGLIACWERGREKRLEDPLVAAHAVEGQLVVLPWKGGVEKVIKKKRKFGTLYYLAMWQGLRDEDLNIDTAEETVLKCAATGMDVVFTSDMEKYAEA